MLQNCSLTIAIKSDLLKNLHEKSRFHEPSLQSILLYCFVASDGMYNDLYACETYKDHKFAYDNEVLCNLSYKQ